MSTKKTLILLATLLVLIVLAGCAAVAPTGSQPDAAAPATVVRIGTQPWIGYGPWWIAKEKGLFEKYGLQVELVDFVQDTEVNAAFASGDMDGANLATHTAMKLFANDVDLRVVLVEDASTSADAILAGEGIASILDLKGKKVAYEEGSTSDLLLNYALQQNGMSLADIQPAPMPAADAGSALIAKQVDAAVTYEPYIAAAIAQDSTVKPIYTAAADAGLISDVFAVSANFAKENPAAVQALIQVWEEAVAFLAANPAEGQAIIAKAVGSTPEELKTAFDGVQFFNLAANQELLKVDGGTVAPVFIDVAKVAQSIGLMDAPPNLARLIDATFVFPKE